MNTIQLECFVTAAEHLSFSKASQVLKITQPAVSHQIQSLEEELDVKLFDRTGRNVSLTPEGFLFLADARLILKTALSARERLGRPEHLLPLELGCHDYTELKLFPPVLRKLAGEFPQLRPSIRVNPFPSLLQLVENNQVHAALGIRGEQKKSPLSFKELCQAPVVCICSPEHPLAACQSLSRRQLTGSFVACSPRQIPDFLFTIQSRILSNLPSEHRYLAENIESTLALVRAQMGYTLYLDIIPAREPGLCYIPATGFPKISFGIYYQKNHDHPVLKRFLALMSEYMKDSAPA